MRLKQLQVFLAVVEAGSIHEAARRFRITQPAVTKTLRALEGELDTRLLERTPNGVIPTRAGALFLVRARKVQAELQLVKQDFAQLADITSGTVSFGISHGALPVLAEALERFRASHPLVEVRIIERVWSTMLPLLRDNTLDFVIARPPQGKSDTAIVARPLLDSEMVVVARKDHPRGRSRSLVAIAGESWITFVPGGGASLLRQAFERCGVSAPQRLVFSESFAVALTLLDATDMFALVPRPLVGATWVTDRLRILPIADPLPHQMMSLYRRTDTRPTAAVTAMMGAFTSAARSFAAQPRGKKRGCRPTRSAGLQPSTIGSPERL